MTFLLALTALVVGGLIGTVGAGGILLIPALSLFAGLSTHEAMATALFSFIFTGLMGTCLYQRRGSIDWHITLPICLGTIAFGYLGSQVNAATSGPLLNLLLAGVIMFAGVYALFPVRGATIVYRPGDTRQKLMLFSMGALVGCAAGLTGVGGPVLSVPLMVVMGFHPLTAIATSQLIQITAGVSGSFGNMQSGFIVFSVAWWVIFAEVAGVAVGVRLAHAIPTATLKKVVAVVCIVVGGCIASRTLWFSVIEAIA